MASASELTVKVKVELDMPELKPEAGPDFPKSPYELDLHHLAAVVYQSSTYFDLGARQRLAGVDRPTEPGTYKDGWEWADRLVAGLEIIHHVESGNP